MKKYRKKTTAHIEAVKINSSNFQEICKWSDGKVTASPLNPMALNVSTNRGSITANIGDWIVKGSPIDYYPVYDEVFTDIYEAIS